MSNAELEPLIAKYTKQGLSLRLCVFASITADAEVYRSVNAVELDVPTGGSKLLPPIEAYRLRW